MDRAVVYAGGMGRCGVAVCQFFVMACAVTEILMNRYQLSQWYYWYWGSTTYYQSCAWGPSTTPCDYLYALGSISLLFNFCVAVIGCFSRNNLRLLVILDFVLSVTNWAWWLAGAIYFTEEYSNAQDRPPSEAPPEKNSWRHAVYAVAWTAFTFCTLSVFFSIYAFLELKKMPKPQHVPTAAADPNQNYAYPTYPPPPPGGYPYPPPPPGAYYPPPPPGGYPPPPPGGYYQQPPPGGYPQPPPGNWPPPAPAQGVPVTGFPAS